MSLDPNNPAGGGNPQHWSSSLPQDFTLEHDGKQIPARDHPNVKEIPDMSALVKQTIDMKRVIGGGLTKIPAAGSKPEEVAAWKKENFGKLAAAGLMELPPESYTITKPEGAVEGVTWSKELEDGFKTLAKDLGLTQSQVDKLLTFDAARMTAAHKTLNTTAEQATAALKSKWGDQYDANFNIASRGVKEIFKDDSAAIALFDEVGLSNHPAFLQAMFEVGARMQEGDGKLPGSGVSAQTREDAGKEMVDIIRNPQNPKYKLFHAGDQATKQYVESLRDKAWPGVTEVA